MNDPDVMADVIEFQKARIDRLEAENKELRKVLKCYADAGFDMARAALAGKSHAE